MTFSNGQFNPNPLANPLNTRLGPSNYSLNPNSVSFSGKIFSKDNIHLPDSKPVDFANIDQLHVPETASRPNLGSLLQMADDYECLLSLHVGISLNGSSQLTLRDIEYQKAMKDKEKQLIDNMTDELKKDLEDIDKIFGKSRFIDESKGK